MTTAHRPTWKPAFAGSEVGGNSLVIPSIRNSDKDLPGHLNLKERLIG